MAVEQSLSPNQLIADYQTAFVAVATAHVAKEEAERSENELMQQLNYWSRSGYLQPSSIGANEQPNVSHASLDAHVKKVQAQQIDDIKAIRLEELSAAAKSNFTHKKVAIEVLAGAEPPIDVLWFNPNTGYRSNVLKKQRVTGLIEEIALDKNILLIKPPYLQRLLNRELVAYVVYVIDPVTAQPAVSIHF